MNQHDAQNICRIKANSSAVKEYHSLLGAGGDIAENAIAIVSQLARSADDLRCFFKTNEDIKVFHQRISPSDLVGHAKEAGVARKKICDAINHWFILENERILLFTGLQFNKVISTVSVALKPQGMFIGAHYKQLNPFPFSMFRGGYNNL